MPDEALASLLRERGIRDDRVLSAIASLDRAAFVPSSQVESAGGDYPLPIGFGQTISQPYIVAYMSSLLALKPGDRVLELGTGSAYQAAVLAKLGADVYSIEIIPELAAAARDRLHRLGLDQVHLRLGDGSNGWPEAAPFDAILLTAAPAKIPEPLLWQLKPGGRLLAPVGGGPEQHLVMVTRGAEGQSHVQRLLPVRFVPLTHHGTHAV